MKGDCGKMFKWFEWFIPAILIISLLAPYSYAITVNIDVSGIVNAVNGNTQSTQQAQQDTKNTLNTSLLGLPLGMFGLFTNSMKDSVKNFNTSLLDLTKELLSANPDPQLMFGWWQSITIIISSFYLIIFLLIGFNFLINGHSIVKREQSKEWLKNAVIMIIGVSTSFYFYQLILGLGSGVTKFMWMTGFEQFFSSTMFDGAGMLMLLSFLVSITLALVTLFFRYLFLLVGVVLFPIGIFLYLTPKFENWGKVIFNFIGIMLAIQFVDVIVLIATQQALTQLVGNAGAGFILPLGFLIVAIINSAMMMYSILKSALAIANNAPIINMAVSAISGNIVGAVGSAKTSGAVN